MKAMKHIIAGVLTALLMLCFHTDSVEAQQPISIQHQYLHLLRWQIHLDKTAAEHEKQGKSGAWLRNAIRNQLHFTDQQFAPITQSAQRLAASLNAIDAKAKPILAAYRAKGTGNIVVTVAGQASNGISFMVSDAFGCSN